MTLARDKRSMCCTIAPGPLKHTCWRQFAVLWVCAAHDLHMTVPGPLERACWRQFVAQGGPCTSECNYYYYYYYWLVQICKPRTNVSRCLTICQLTSVCLPCHSHLFASIRISGICWYNNMSTYIQCNNMFTYVQYNNMCPMQQEVYLPQTFTVNCLWIQQCLLNPCTMLFTYVCLYRHVY